MTFGTLLHSYARGGGGVAGVGARQLFCPLSQEPVKLSKVADADHLAFGHVPSLMSFAHERSGDQVE